jgi:hypothetical protein
MVDGSRILGRPLSEVSEVLEAAGAKFTVRTTGLVGRTAMERRSDRDGLVTAESRVVQLREHDQELELVVAPTFHRAGAE